MQQRTLWGWHRLCDDWVSRLVLIADVRAGELVLDIGAGDGAISDRLLRAGARPVAIELHPQRLARLRAKYEGTAVRVVRANITELRLPRQPFVVVSNPPFATTTSLLKLLLAPDSRVLRAELVVPHHVAARWASGRGADAYRWESRFEATLTERVPRSAFRPAAPDDAAVLSLRPRRRRRK